MTQGLTGPMLMRKQITAVCQANGRWYGKGESDRLGKAQPK